MDKKMVRITLKSVKILNESGELLYFIEIFILGILIGLSEKT